MSDILYKCPACYSDGIETCHNPDHGFYYMISFHYDSCNGGRGCPVCGWDDKHKIKRYNSQLKSYEYNKCYECDGTGYVSRNKCEKILEEYSIDIPVDEFIKE